MSRLWQENPTFTVFDPDKHHINDTCSRNARFIPYIRKYTILSHEQLLELINDAKTNKWQALDLRNCGLSQLPDELWELSDLSILYLGNTHHLHISDITENPPYSDNNLSTIPREIEGLKNLKVLSLERLPLYFEDDYTLKLPNLIHLDLFDCGFPQIPKALLIPSIKELGFNCLEETLDNNFAVLKRLERIFLSQSFITELPEYIGTFKNLSFLYLPESQLSKLPNSMARLNKLSYLNIQDTPLGLTLPPEILKQTGIEIVNYILSQQSGASKGFFNESKMIIVGQGHVGKTCLLNRLVNDDFSESDSTEGIDITAWTFTRQNQSYTLNVWDFGGQEIYHSTHQFFLTKRSLYVLVWDALAEEEYGRIDYWLKTIQSLADDSPIFIVVNKCDRDIGRIRRLDEDDYKSRFPQIVDIFYVSCKDNLGINELRDAIINRALALPLMKTSWLLSWMKIRRKLEKLSVEENYITYSQYLALCRKDDIGKEEAKSLIKYLHDLGIVLYYHDDRLLKNLVILSSEWGTNAVYKVLDEQERHLKGRNGLLHTDDLPAIWNDTDCYPPEQYPNLLRLMERFQLAFEVDSTSYLVAELLDNKTVSLDISFNYNETLSFRYDYDFIPAGIMTRFIVSINHYLYSIDGVKQCWKKGAYLKHGTASALVRLYDSVGDRFVVIKVSGKNPRDCQELLTIIRITFDKINSQFSQIQITKKIPCICSPNCNFLFNYETLLLAESKRKSTVECHNTLDDVDLKKLLDGVEVYMDNKFGQPNFTAIFSPQVNPTISPVITATATSTSEASATNNTTITVEIRDLINGLQGDFADLMDEADNAPEEFEELCKKVKKALEKLDSCKTKEDIVKSGAMNKIQRFLEECNNETTKTGKFLVGLKYAADIVKKLAGKYNTIATWTSLAPLPFGG